MLSAAIMAGNVSSHERKQTNKQKTANDIKTHHSGKENGRGISVVTNDNITNNVFTAALWNQNRTAINLSLTPEQQQIFCFVRNFV
jgi:hypothetical protein